MDLYTLCTPSHKIFVEQFLLPSADGFHVHVTEDKQQGNGQFANEQWFPSMRRKAEAMLSAAVASKGGIFVWADCDILFLADDCPEWLESQLGDYELAAQQEHREGHLCAGFLVARGTDAVIELFDGMAKCDDGNDQRYLNENKDKVLWKTLPTPEVWTLGHLPNVTREAMIGSMSWRQEIPGMIAEGVKIFHANYLTDIDSKVNVLNLVAESRSLDLSPCEAPKVHEAGSVEVKATAVMTLPRYGSLAARGLMERAVNEVGIPLVTTQGVFWGQHMQNMFEGAIDDVDVIVTIDFDSVFLPQDLRTLLQHLLSRSDIDCLAALEPRRNNEFPLMTAGGETSIETDHTPIKVTTAHLGLTALKTEKLKTVPFPWFQGVPGPTGHWDDDRMDADIFFWHQWREAGHTIYVDPEVRIAHLEETVSYYDARLRLQRCSVPEWRDRFVKREKITHPPDTKPAHYPEPVGCS